MYMELDGEGPLPVLHFGMTGMIQVGSVISRPRVFINNYGNQIKNGPKMYYRTKPPDETKWPPLYMKVFFHSLGCHQK